MTDKYEIPDEPVDINGEWMKIATAQAATIERLAGFIQSYMDNFQKCPYCFEGQYNDDDCRNCHGTGQIIISVGVLYVELPTAARALLAEVRGAE